MRQLIDPDEGLKIFLHAAVVIGQLGDRGAVGHDPAAAGPNPPLATATGAVTVDDSYGISSPNRNFQAAL